MWRASKIDDLDSLCEVTHGTSLHKTKKNDNNSKISLMPVRYTNGNILQATNGNNKGAIPCKFEKQYSQLQRNVTFHKQAISLKILILRFRDSNALKYDPYHAQIKLKTLNRGENNL